MKILSIISNTCSALIAALVLSSCSGTQTNFTPPDQRPISAVEKPWKKNSFLVLSYHDVEDTNPDQAYISVRTDYLKQQFAWLRENNYMPINVDQVLAAQSGGTQLPEKAVMLTFDDGYSSFYTHVLPLLKAYQWPAVLAPVGSWLDTPADTQVNFGGLLTPRKQFLNWQQVKEIVDSGLVELGSHTDNLHYGIQANPQGNMQPAAAAHRYDPKTQSYESEAEYTQRIKKDIEQITKKLKNITGKDPRVWIWPYGQDSGKAVSLVKQAGYKLLMSLEDGIGSVDKLDHIPRVLVSNNPDLISFANICTGAESYPTMRVVHIDLDYVYDSDPEQMERNLGQMIQRVADLSISTVFLQAFADPEGDGLIKSLYFPNRHLPMRADLFNRAAWQLNNRTGVDVYAWMPVLGFDLSPSINRVTRWKPTTNISEVDSTQYPRLSPFDPVARQQIIEIYDDLAQNAIFQGLLYHDDALLSDFEDASPYALAAYQAAGLPNSIEELRSNSKTLQKWTRFKSKYLIDFTHVLTEHVRAVRGPDVATARNIYALPILNPESETWFAQNLDDFLAAYTWTAPMAMPLMEGVSEDQAEAWLDEIVDAVATRPGALSKTVFEVQGHDWSGTKTNPTNKQIPSETMASWLRRIHSRGAKNFGYYPDDFIQNLPRLEVIRPALSNAWYPWK